MKKYNKIILWLLLGGITCIVLLIAVCDIAVSWNASGKTYNNLDDIPHNKVGLLLATSPITPDGKHNINFDNRINAVDQLYQAGKIDLIIASGGDYTKSQKIGCDEPRAILDSLVARGVPADKIILDYEGTRTLNSIAKAKDIYSLNSLTLISQKYHNERAIYLADKYGINAIGYNADPSPSLSNRIKNALREYLARVKMFVDIKRGLRSKVHHFQRNAYTYEINDSIKINENQWSTYEFNIHTNPLAFRLDDSDSDFKNEKDLFEHIISNSKIRNGTLKFQYDSLEKYLNARFYLNDAILDSCQSRESTSSLDASLMLLPLNKLKCLNYFLIKVLHHTPELAILTDSIDHEFTLMTDFLESQYQLFRCHNSDRGSYAFATYIDLELDMVNVQNKFLQNILGVKQTSQYHPELTDGIIQYQYDIFKHNGFSFYEGLETYNPGKDKKTF